MMEIPVGSPFEEIWLESPDGQSLCSHARA
jgi:hypothetical protein